MYNIHMNGSGFGASTPVRKSNLCFQTVTDDGDLSEPSAQRAENVKRVTQ